MTLSPAPLVSGLEKFHCSGKVMLYIYSEHCYHTRQVFERVRDGLNETMPEYGEDSNRGKSVTNAWDFVQERVRHCECIYV